ncbi:MAG: hypothetical protein KU37_08025 [Sulfuricurvum sp. PC08-66]|nr:MAG: hypothetical protein KU37_08025 [Sulfuricurvum sp. PC08-66]
MLLLGHPLFKKPPFYDVTSIDAILQTPSNSTLYIAYRPELHDVIEHCALNRIAFALGVKNVREAVYAHNYGASYIITTRIIAPLIQKIAENYMFDAKVLVWIEREEEIEEVANLGIDGAIFPEGIVKVI